MQSVVLFTHGFQRYVVETAEIYEALSKQIPKRIVKMK